MKYDIVGKLVLSKDKEYGGDHRDPRVFVAKMIANHPATLRSGAFTLYQRHA
jgi:hypothetical protein